MNFRSTRGRRGRVETSIDITSLVDVVFLLLIFLLVTTTFKREEHAFPVELPTSSVKQVTITTDKTTIFITKDGGLHLLTVPSDAAPGVPLGQGSADALTDEELEKRLAELHERRPDAPVAIRAEQETRYQRMIDVVALVESAGFTNLYFPYEHEAGAPPAPGSAPAPAPAPAPSPAPAPEP
ncbi:MAG: biopolymer transporter ExbD [Deltaproteobacteria bacterium]|nr:biopolymer transporter ExbD [Deltaproteobacteria bacterium]MCB9786369.1 biopolymer transporter ExbD [Deltaproteobacteria bacterium]